DIGYGVSDISFCHQKLRDNIDLVFGVNVVDLCHDARYVPVDVKKAMSFREAWKYEVREVSTHVGVAVVDEICHSPWNKFRISFFVLFVVEDNNTLFRADFFTDM